MSDALIHDVRSCLRRIKARQRAALGDLYDATSGRAYALACGVVSDTASAERVVADLYLHVWRADRIDLEPAEGFVGRLLFLCRELALESLHASGVSPAALPVVDLASVIGSGNPLHVEISRLDARQRELLSLALFRGMSVAQIATHVDMPPAEVQSTLDAAVRALDASTDLADLDAILFTPELRTRASRAPDFAAENRALRSLAEALADPAGPILSTLAGSALELCRAQSAGISILEPGEAGIVFRWHALVGEMASLQGGCLPRDASPCGIVIDHDSPQLVVRPDRHFPAVRPVSPRLNEVLLVPFRLLGQPVGTIWVVAHDEDTHFDVEDSRVIESMAAFASAAYILRSSQQAAMDARDELIRTNDRLSRSNGRLLDKLAENHLA